MYFNVGVDYYYYRSNLTPAEHTLTADRIRSGEPKLAKTLKPM
jgi:hypothetical protein